jgi:radical SAM-linked protein
VQRVRVRYAKRGRLKFASHRDFARALERALRRAGVPMALSAGFTPHPKISYLGAAPTGVASEAEYLEIGLSERVDPAWLLGVLDAALPAGLDVLECVEAGPGALADRIDASHWRIELPGVPVPELSAAVAAFLAEERVEVERLTKDGRRALDARAAVVSAVVSAGTPASPPGASTQVDMASCAILDMVVRQVTPAVRPDDVLAALRAVADLEPLIAPRATRMAQGQLDDTGGIADPLGPDRVVALAAREGAPGPAGEPVVGHPA